MTALIIKAVVFSNFPENYADEHFRPKLAKFGVDTLRMINIDRSGVIDMKDADVIISMVDLMSQGQKKKVRELARKYNRRCLEFSRQTSSWAKLLAPVITAHEQKPAPISSRPPPPSTSLVLVPPPPREEPPPPSSEEFEEPTESIADENVRLQELVTLFGEENTKLEEQKNDLISRLRKSDELVSALEKQVEARDTKFSKLENELARANRHIIDIERKQAATVTATTSLDKALEHIKALWKMGLMKPEDVLKMIFKEP